MASNSNSKPVSYKEWQEQKQRSEEYDRYSQDEDVEEVYCAGPVSKKKKLNFEEEEDFKEDSRSGPVSNIPTIYPQLNTSTTDEWRPVCIDAQNVMYRYSKGEILDVRGLETVVDYFSSLGIRKIVAFYPQNKINKSNDPEKLLQYEREDILCFTPARSFTEKQNGEHSDDNESEKYRVICSHDDKFMLDYASSCGGIIVSRDNFREFIDKKDEWRDVIEKRLIQPTFVHNCVMFPNDPLGRYGPSLHNFLKF